MERMTRAEVEEIGRCQVMEDLCAYKKGEAI